MVVCAIAPEDSRRWQPKELEVVASFTASVMKQGRIDSSAVAVAAPGAGFAETAEYQKLGANRAKVPAWEQKLWQLYDATDYAANFANLPVVAYNAAFDIPFINFEPRLAMPPRMDLLDPSGAALRGRVALGGRAA
mgnify:CR=1 FL=1